MLCFTLSAGLLIAGLALPGVLSAGVVGLFGDIQLLPGPPFSVRIDDLESNQMILFQEQDLWTLPVPIAADITTTGTFSSPSQLTPGVIAAGTIVNSYFLSFDPLGNFGSGIYFGWITFGEPVIGIEIRSSSLRGTSQWLGASGTLYPWIGPPDEGLELSNNYDILTLARDRHSLSLRGLTRPSDPIDQVRVITSPIPEPMTLLLAGVGLSILAVSARSRTRL